MMPCSRWREELLSHAAGAPARAALAEHLRNCAACAAALQARQARMREIDGGLPQLAAEEVSSRVANRVLAEVRARERRRSGTLDWKTIVAGAIVAALLAIPLARLRYAAAPGEESGRVLSAASTIAHWKSPTAELLRIPAESWWKEAPRLGEDYFGWSADSSKKEPEYR